MSKFDFELDDKVCICDNEKGHVVARADYMDSKSMYHVRYVNGAGNSVENWWPKSALKSVKDCGKESLEILESMD